jgi:hypothetical protein
LLLAFRGNGFKACGYAREATFNGKKGAVSNLDGLLPKPLPNHNSFTAKFQYK